MIRVLYVAALAEQAGRQDEWLSPDPSETAGLLYDRLARQRGLTLSRQQLRVAINERFADWSAALRAGDQVAFLPPMSGG